MRFAVRRAQKAQQLNRYAGLRETVEFCRGLCTPLYAIARGSLRVFPFLRRFDGLLKIDSLARRHPAVLGFTPAFVLWRGLKTTWLGTSPRTS